MINKRLEDLREVMRREHLAACSHGDRCLGIPRCPATTDIFLHFVRHENNFMRPENIGFDFFRNFAPSNDN